MYYYFQAGKHCLQGQSVQAIPKPDQSFEQRQVLLGHCAQIAMYLSVMIVTCLRAMKSEETEEIELADEFCIQTREKINMHYLQIRNHSRQREQVLKNRGMNILDGEYANAIEQNILAFELPGIKVV